MKKKSDTDHLLFVLIDLKIKKHICGENYSSHLSCDLSLVSDSQNSFKRRQSTKQTTGVCLDPDTNERCCQCR